MPSPFPGMDPFLESPEYFSDFHDTFLVHMKERLQPLLPETYFAKTRQRVWLEYSARYVEPDISVAASGGPAAKPSASRAAVADAGYVVTLEQVPHDERSEILLEVYVWEKSQKRLVTSIELLSPANKTPDERGQELYKQKQREILDSRVHLIEIDLLREGKHTTAVPRELAERKCGPFDYHVCVHRFDRPDDYHVYPARLEDRLPRIEIPLLPGDPPVTLDLQAVFDESYDRSDYAREIRYAADQVVPALDGAQQKWATALLENQKQLKK